MIKTRVEGAIHPIQMFLQLCSVVIPKKELNRKASTTPYESIPSGSLFEEKKTAFEELKKAFADLYREDFQQLEGIRKEQAPTTAWSQLKTLDNSDTRPELSKRRN